MKFTKNTQTHAHKKNYINNNFFLLLLIILLNAEENLKSIGKFKDWESFVLLKEGNKICFAQSIPVVKAPKKFKRDPSRLFVSFRPAENIKNEVSVTNGYEFKLKAPSCCKIWKKNL